MQLKMGKIASYDEANRMRTHIFIYLLLLVNTNIVLGSHFIILYWVKGKKTDRKWHLFILILPPWARTYILKLRFLFEFCIFVMGNDWWFCWLKPIEGVDLTCHHIGGNGRGPLCQVVADEGFTHDWLSLIAIALIKRTFIFTLASSILFLIS